MLSFHPSCIRFVPLAMMFGLGCTTPLDSSDENGHSANAPELLFYAATGEACCGEDPHPVHGVEAPDGSFILGGKSIDDQGAPDGFVLKIGPTLPNGYTVLEEEGDQRVTWSHTFGTSGKQDGVNAVAATETAVFVVGYTHTDSRVGAALRKLDLGTGALIWATTIHGSDANTEAAFESIELTEDGGALVGGLVNAEPGGLEGFKSYGNPVSGTAQIAYFSPEQLTANSPPSAPSWQTSFPELVSIRAVRPIQGDGSILVAATPDESYTVYRLDDNGDRLWTTALEEHGEATDIAVQATGDGAVLGFAVTGHKKQNGGIDGSVTRLDLQGNVQWSRVVGNPMGGTGEFEGLGAGNPKLIYDECWGIQSTASGGVVLACGTGIEGCGGTPLGSALRRECTADPRTKWRALTIELDEAGQEVWHRTDSFVFEEEPDTSAASAAEYVIRLENGQTASVIDQDFGIGLILYGAPSDTP